MQKSTSGTRNTRTESNCRNDPYEAGHCTFVISSQLYWKDAIHAAESKYVRLVLTNILSRSHQCRTNPPSKSVMEQIGLFSYPDGAFRPITNDLTDHTSLSIAGDGHTLATVQKETSTQIVLMPPSGAGPLTPVPGIAARETLPSFSWRGDGQLLISHGDHLVRQHTDGTRAVTILSDPAAWISAPVSCDNDRWIALNWMFHGEGNGNRLWRANPDGSDPVPLTSGDFGSFLGMLAGWKVAVLRRANHERRVASLCRRRQTRTRAGSEPSQFDHVSGHTFPRRQNAGDIYRSVES